MKQRKPSVSVKKTKNGIEIVTKFYNEFGKVVKKQVEAVRK